MRRLTRRVTYLCITLISLCVMALTVSAHPGPEHVHPCGADGHTTERTHTLPNGVVMSVRTTYCRPVRHGSAPHTQTRSP